MVLKSLVVVIIGMVFNLGMLSPASAFTVEIDNKSGTADENVWVMVTANGGSPSIGLLNPKKVSELPKTGNTGNVPYPYFTFDELVAGRIYFSLDRAMPAENILDPGRGRNMATIRYDWVEVTQDGSQNAAANLTSVDQFGIPLAIRTYKNEVQQAQAGYCKPANVVMESLKKLSKDAFVTDGVKFVRVLAPVKSPESYPSFDTCLNSLKGRPITIKGYYYGTPPGDYNYNGSVTSTGDINLKSASNNSFSILSSDLTRQAVYFANGAYYVNDKKIDSLANDMDGAVYRDVMTGFNMGYFGVENDSSKWPQTKPFQNGNGNQYAKIIHECSDSYGYPFTDNSNKVLISIDPAKVDTLRISILADNTTDGCSKPALRLAAGNFDKDKVKVKDVEIGDDLVVADHGGGTLLALGRTKYSSQQLPRALKQVTVAGLRQLPLGDLNQVASGDLNGDGLHEIIGLTDSGKIQVYNTVSEKWHWVPGELSQIAACDLNGDKMEELIGINSRGEISYTMDLSHWQILPGPPGGLKQLACADFDGNRFSDIAGVNSSGEVYISYNRADWQKIPGKMAQVTSAYIDDDFIPDLVGLSLDGHIFYTLDRNHWVQVHAPALFTRVAGGKSRSGPKLIGMTPKGDIYYTMDLMNWTHVPGKFSSTGDTASNPYGGKSTDTRR
jgi:hypothetical protein